MTNPGPSGQDKIKLLIEETGCDIWQAELALKSAGYNVEKAVKTIGTLLKNIVVVRGNMMLETSNLHGLFILVMDMKSKKILRARSVVTYNPAVHEISLENHWYEFEKSIYAFRLREGAVQHPTQSLETALKNAGLDGNGEEFFSVMTEVQPDRIVDLLRHIVQSCFANQPAELRILREELNLNQYKRIKMADEPGGGDNADSGRTSPHSALFLEVSIMEKPQGMRAGDMSVGDMTAVRITDGRDIAQYMAKLIGGAPDQEAPALRCPVEQLETREGSLHVHVYLSSGIMGEARLDPEALVDAERPKAPSWWKKFFQ